MEDKLENRLNICIKNTEKQFSKNDSYTRLQEASRLFDNLVANGLAKRRGNNLHLSSNGQIFVSFNI